MHGHFDLLDIAPDSVVEQAKERVAINSGIAIVIPAEKIVEVLNVFANEDAEEADRFRAKKLSMMVTDSLKGSN